MSRHQGDWAQTTARVLSHVLMVSRVAERTITAQDQAAIDKVWAHVGVRRDEYDDSGQWKKVAPVRREGVRQRLVDGYRDAFRASDPKRLGRSDAPRTAFLPGGRASRAGQARREFKRAHLLDWGNRLLAAEAANVAPPPPPPPPPAAEEAAASVASESSDEDSTDPDTISPTIASLPEDTRATVVAIMERAAAEGYELSDWDELLRYARNRYVEAAVDPDRYVEAADELGAVNAARDRIIAKAAPSESVSRSRSGRDGASVMSDSSLFSRLLELSLDSEREALRHLHSDLLGDRVRVHTIPGLKMKKKKKKVKKAIAKELNRWGKKIEKAFKM
ncbi:unnamed protein product [Pelagomonas calceolata]|uniref:Uncharacterized protein n=1 Tax=Pelagomonas calceolata TaxID=35677 RepID=A0A8J2WTH1_9STRA|nr:unnamed protein product [Pelagomonas calceolata]